MWTGPGRISTRRSWPCPGLSLVRPARRRRGPMLPLLLLPLLLLQPTCGGPLDSQQLDAAAAPSASSAPLRGWASVAPPADVAAPATAPAPGSVAAVWDGDRWQGQVPWPPPPPPPDNYPPPPQPTYSYGDYAAAPPPGLPPLPAPAPGSIDIESEAPHGIHVANWRWNEVGIFFTFTAFIVICGLAKVAFHHAHWLSSRIPESCLMICVGVAVGGVLYLCGVPEPENKEDRVVPDEFHLPTFTPRLFFLILLPPVILESAYSLYNRAFAVNLHTVLLYAIVGTLLNTFTIGLMLYALSEAGAIGRLPVDSGSSVHVTLPDCMVFSALISAVDPVAVLAIFQEVGVNQDLYYLLFGESLLNDAVTVVLYTTMVTFAELPEVHGEQYVLAVLAFFTVSLGGLSLGVVFGLVTALLTRTTEEVRVVEPLAVLGIAYLSYITAELFHFSGIISIIGCGLAQSHYALRNISSKSYTTVNSTSDAIIFLFLGMVLVSDRHVWHTGFVSWTLFLCLICRFGGVLLLTGLSNMFRAKKINLQEQFIMGYGGLRGAIAFSLVEMLDEQTVRPRHVMLTTTLVVILFTIFFQGATIKPLVKLLNIEKSRDCAKTLNEEISDNVLDHMMAGIEEIVGVRGDFYIRRKWEYVDEVYLKRIFLRDANKENSLTRLYEKLALTQHFAHLYGPVTLVEDHKATILHNGDALGEVDSEETGTQTSVEQGLDQRFPGVQLRRRSPYDWPPAPGPAQVRASWQPGTVGGGLPPALALRRTSSAAARSMGSTSYHLSAQEVAESTETLRKAFRSSPYQKYCGRFGRHAVDDESQDLSDQLKRRHLTARRITSMAALVHRNTHVSDPSLGAAGALTAALGLGQLPRRQIHSELDELLPEELEGIEVIL
ncbi:hypothetical protein FOCC_FOCC011040, partial [Frankliniella occidentalis]